MTLRPSVFGALRRSSLDSVCQTGCMRFPLAELFEGCVRERLGGEGLPWLDLDPADGSQSTRGYPTRPSCSSDEGKAEAGECDEERGGLEGDIRLPEESDKFSACSSSSALLVKVWVGGEEMPRREVEAAVGTCTLTGCCPGNEGLAKGPTRPASTVSGDGEGKPLPRKPA